MKKTIAICIMLAMFGPVTGCGIFSHKPDPTFLQEAGSGDDLFLQVAQLAETLEEYRHRLTPDDRFLVNSCADWVREIEKEAAWGPGKNRAVDLMAILRILSPIAIELLKVLKACE